MPIEPERPPQKPNPESQEREPLSGFVSVMLAMFFGGGFLLFLVVISFNVFLYVIAAAVLIALFVGVHYLIWGRWRPPGEE